MNDHNPRLISIVGPTAVGKTAVGIEVAKKLGVEIISADSRQFYQEMQIGTAKPTDKELKAVKHHFINSHSIGEFYSAGAFERDVLVKLEEMFETNDQVLMVGGSGLYAKAVWEGFDAMPDVDEGIRAELIEEFEKDGLDPLLDELRLKDAQYYEIVDHKNHQRIIRALEVIRASGLRFSSLRNRKSKTVRPFEIVKIGLEMDREKLNKRIEDRMDQMIASGLFEEAERLFPQRKLNALQTVGYKEIFDFMEGSYDREEAIRLLKRNSRRYAKRQMTWFKADSEIIWVDAATPIDDILVSLQPA